ncbi:MAG: Tn3 family transposase [Actinobacteria bacterium]|nr:Tn3 family transposase [Actinomycetota bacterium]
MTPATVHITTELVFAGFDLLGRRFIPRLSDIADVPLYGLGPGQPHLAADMLLTRRVRDELIAGQWEELLRLARPDQARLDRPSVLLTRMHADPRPDRLAKALREYGRLVRTNFILDWVGDPVLRARGLGQLNKGESANALHRYVGFGNRGRVYARDPEQLQRHMELIDELSALARASGYTQLLAWARVIDGERVWALEDVRGVSRGLERFLLEHGEHVVRVPPKLMAGARKSARTYGKSDSIDALAIARAVLAHPQLPAAAQDDAARELQLLTSHREALVRQRSEAQDRLRWLLHDIDPDVRIPAGALDRKVWLDRVARRLARCEQTVAVRIARDLVRRCRSLTPTPTNSSARSPCSLPATRRSCWSSRAAGR